MVIKTDGCWIVGDPPNPALVAPQHRPRPTEPDETPPSDSPPKRPSRSAAAEMRTARQALQKATGEVVRKESAIEVMFAQQIHLLKLPAPKRNYLFMPGRKLELDFAWPDRKIAVEVQGMVHRIHGRFCADIEKRALALLAGWKILEVGGKEIRNGKASQWLQELLNQDADNELRRLGVPIE